MAPCGLRNIEGELTKLTLLVLDATTRRGNAGGSDSGQIIPVGDVVPLREDEALSANWMIFDERGRQTASGQAEDTGRACLAALVRSSFQGKERKSR